MTYKYFYGRIMAYYDIFMRKDGVTMAEDTLLTDEELEKKRKRNAIWDKITTGILIALMASPIAILAYIFLWFILK